MKTIQINLLLDWFYFFSSKYYTACHLQDYFFISKLHIPEEGISALSNDLLNSFEKSNQEHEIEEKKKKFNSQETSVKEEACVGSVVAQHYNQLSERGVAERKESRIFHMRNLNNWIKSRIIGKFYSISFEADFNIISLLGNILDRIRKEKGNHCRLNVLDLGCGKGGDLLKWERGRVNHVVCADIAETSIEQCKDRYEKLKQRSRQVFTAEFIATDCSKVPVNFSIESLLPYKHYVFLDQCNGKDGKSRFENRHSQLSVCFSLFL